MLNLIALHDRAAYPDGRAISGADAYRLYGETSAPVFQRVGGRILWRGAPRCVLIGPSTEQWDLAFIAAYPSASAFLEMVTDAFYQAEAVPHRRAAVRDSRLIRNAPSGAGSAFG